MKPIMFMQASPFPFGEGDVHSQHGQPNNRPSVPARIDVALDFLNFLSSKRRSQVVSNEMQVEVVTPDQLTNEEVATQDSALNLLANYFDGKFQPNQWEMLELAIQASQMNVESFDSSVGGIKCPICAGRSKNCFLCGGSGNILLTRDRREKTHPEVEVVVEKTDLRSEVSETDKVEPKTNPPATEDQE